MGRADALRPRGKMLWFNDAKDLGALRTDDDERIEILGAAFSTGERPVGRCAGRAVEFDYVDGAVDNVRFVPEERSRRARTRHRR